MMKYYPYQRNLFQISVGDNSNTRYCSVQMYFYATLKPNINDYYAVNVVFKTDN